MVKQQLPITWPHTVVEVEFLSNKVTLKSLQPSSRYSTDYFLNFSRNHAHYGGAIYVADDTNSGACLPNSECFIQTLTLHQYTLTSLIHNLRNVLFSGNTAIEQGANLFGGLLDRCIPSSFAKVYLQQRTPHYSGVS